MGTIVFGIILAALNGYLVQAYTLDCDRRASLMPKYIAIGIGMWLGTIMWFNVWFIIWPNQQKVLNIGNANTPICSSPSARGGQDGGPGLAASTRAVDPDAVLHGRRSASVRLKSRFVEEGRPGMPGGPFICHERG